MIKILIILGIGIILAVVVGTITKDEDNACAILGLTVIILMFLLLIACCQNKEVNVYEEKQYNIQGLENKIEVKEKAKGVFVLGIGTYSQDKKQENKYYFVKVTKKGKQIKSIDMDNHVWLRETDDTEPCLIHEYTEVENYGIAEWFWGKDKHMLDYNYDTILVVPTNTIKIDYNVDI